MSETSSSISLVIPTFNAENNISRLCKELIKIFGKFKTQIIIINDCSQDNTHEECLKLIKEHGNELAYIKLSKNVGEHNAVMAGLKYSSGDWVIIMDDDFQNPPSEALKLLNFSLSNQFDVVYGNYKKKKHNFFRNLVSKVNDLTANYILNKPKGLYLSSFKAINKKIVKKVSNYNGPFPYIDGLIIALTSNIGSIETQHDERKTGKSGYSFMKFLKLFGNMATNFFYSTHTYFFNNRLDNSIFKWTICNHYNNRKNYKSFASNWVYLGIHSNNIFFWHTTYFYGFARRIYWKDFKKCK